MEDARERARSLFENGDFAGSLAAAREALQSAPDDAELLILAGRAGVEVDSDDAVANLRRATELSPDDATVWHYLGEALVTEGSTAEAEAVFRRAVELDPDDQVALTHLGHTAVATGRGDEGVGLLARAAEIQTGASSAAISLVDMYRSFGQYDEALAQARKLLDAAPDDLLTWLDVAELSLALGQLDEARAAFEQLRELDEVPGHEAYPLHGMILAELRRDGWDSARELVAQAVALDPYGLGTEVAALVSAESSDERPPTPEQVEAALSSSLADYREMLADDRQVGGGEAFG